MANLHSVNIKSSQLLNYNGQLLCVDIDGKIWSLNTETEGMTARHVWREWNFPFMKVDEKPNTMINTMPNDEAKLARNF